MKHNLSKALGGLQDEFVLVKEMLPLFKFSKAEERLILRKTEDFIEKIRNHKGFSVEQFIHRFSLTSDEGVAVMCLAEALLRVPDNKIARDLAIDKLSDKSWGSYIFKRSSSFKEIFTSLGLYLSGKFSDLIKKDNILVNLVDRLGKPIFIKALKSAILHLSKEFVFASDIDSALEKAVLTPEYNFSFDLLGESSRTIKQADYYYDQYNIAIDKIADKFPDQNCELSQRPNLSVKLTALYPRFELTKFEDLKTILFPKILSLVEKIRDNNMTVTFDAEESFRLDAYILFLTELIEHESLKDWNGIGLVVQAYQTRSYDLVKYIIDLAKKTKKNIPIRLVKGAYWDSEIRHAQVLGMEFYPVFTKKEHTDSSYISCARLILENQEYIFPQFATHNALTAATIIELAGNKDFEFQKLYGMGNALHSELLKEKNVRVYAPVGKSNDLLAYLMRRMLENAANSSFVSKVTDRNTSLLELSYDLHDKVINSLGKGVIALPADIYPGRKNAMGYDLGHKENYDYISEKVASFFSNSYKVGSIIDGKEIINPKHSVDGFCPAKSAEKFSSVSHSVESEIKSAIDSASNEFRQWTDLDVAIRAEILNKIANSFEDNKFELYALLIKEAGKTIHDAINEVVEAIDFCRYYALSAKNLMRERELPGPTGEKNTLTMHGRGVFLCISPWNFPLAIFTGQVVAALVTGNSVIAKPADQTSAIANFAIKLMHKAGVPKSALHLVLTSGSNVGRYIVPDERISGVAFTGSTSTAKIINKTLAERNSGIVSLIAETGGQNAMIVDSSALLEQVTDDVLISAFYSAGQRCSALRILYIQEEIYDDLFSMIKEGVELLKISDTADFSSDIGPVIDKASFDHLTSHINDMREKGFRISEHPHKDSKKDGYYFYPYIIEIDSINDVPDEKFGPILHVIKYKSTKLDDIIAEINNYGFGLTFGIHTRIEEKIEYIRSKIKAGNIYANRSIVGAKVESQPFGGENKSGTGFKAGGPNYLLRFMLERTTSVNLTAIGGNIDLLKGII
jgi:RHH-type proline utilization regulon transcriptional repressor/proline dehydrogenase/delta 1-pyrroline-5-carboxylate dehydrogenase